ncbi:MAG: ADP-ribosylglycohydrolase family protein [Fastidiosipilaceae bacterium]|nr:ADP-ribosylglycohydrolase [Clostridiaceae bacterium]
MTQEQTLTISLYDGLMAAIVGDYMGVPVEFRSREFLQENPVTEPLGNGTYQQPPGTWSDDSSMLIATVASLTNHNLMINYGDLMDSFAAWYFDSMFTPHGEVFNVGNTTAAALRNYRSGVEPTRCGGSGLRDNGNGSLMRILPLAYIKCTNEEIDRVSALTHSHKISKLACRIYVRIVQKLLALRQTYAPEGMPERLEPPRKELYHRKIVDVIENLVTPEMQDYVIAEAFHRLANIDTYTINDINSSGYVVDSLEAALWCFLTTDTLSACILKAVNLGVDTDTIGCLAGGLAGSWYGGRVIPQTWLEVCAKRDKIVELCNVFDKIAAENK